MTNRVELNTDAPDFSLTDFAGRRVSLSDYRGRKNIVLVFNRGFS
jgi:peroxiredoxin